MFLVLVDAHSKWLEVYHMTASTSQATIQKLRVMFAQFALPNTVVTDNAKCFTSDEFAEFLEKNGISHITSAPYHPSSNGLAERAVQSFKQGMKKFTKGTLTDRLSRFLYHYRNTPHTTTGVTPSELLLGRRPRSHLDIIRPDLCSRVSEKQQRQKQAHDSRARARNLAVVDMVYARGYGRGQPHWIPAQIVQRTGPVSFKVELDSGGIYRRHQDQLRKRFATTTDTTYPDTATDATPDTTETLLPRPFPLNIPEATPPEVSELPSLTNPDSHQLNDSAQGSPPPQEDTQRRYPSRERRPPQKLTY